MGSIFMTPYQSSRRYSVGAAGKLIEDLSPEEMQKRGAAAMANMNAMPHMK